jgi:hypothetical protein
MKLRTVFVASMVLTLASLVLAQQNQAPTRSTERITKEVGHELLMLPYLGVFDNGLQLRRLANGDDRDMMLRPLSRPKLSSDSCDTLYIAILTFSLL